MVIGEDVVSNPLQPTLLATFLGDSSPAPRCSLEAAVCCSMMAMSSIIERVKDSNNFHQALDDTLADFSILLQADRGLLILFNEHDDAVVAHEFCMFDDLPRLRGTRIVDRSLMNLVAETPSPVPLTYLGTGTTAGMEGLIDGPISSSLLGSLKIRGRQLGVLAIQTREPREWHAEDVAQVQLYCTCMATLIQAMRLGDDLTRISLDSVRQLNQTMSLSERYGLVPPDVAKQLRDAAIPLEHEMKDRVLAAKFPLLTDREREVLLRLSEKNREIGTSLGLTEGTVKVHVTSIIRKLRVMNRQEAIRLAANALDKAQRA